MAAVTSYTTTEAIRACLGLDVSDCKDRVILDSLLHQELLADLGSWLPGHAALHAAGVADDPVPTPAQALVASLISLYAQWYCACQLAQRPLLFIKEHTDGQAGLKRYDFKDWQALVDFACAKMRKYKGDLDEEVNEVVPDIVGFAHLAVSTPSYDPVSGRGSRNTYHNLPVSA